MAHRPIIERTEGLHVRQLRPAVPAKAARALLEIESCFGSEELEVTGKLTNLRNGYLYYLVCNQCGKRRLSLYRQDLGRYACRECLGLLYASSLRLCA